MDAQDHTAPHEVRLAYQRGYEKGYDAGFDAGSRDWHPLRNMLLTDPETGEPMFICGAPEPDVLGLMLTEQQIDEIIRWPLQAFDTPEEVARAVARAAYSFAMGER